MNELLIKIACINGRDLPETTFCQANGQKHFYTEFDFPPIVTSALGLGCSGRTIGVLRGKPAPVLSCVVHESQGQSFLVAISCN